jgi:hypothetical protein
LGCATDGDVAEATVSHSRLAGQLSACVRSRTLARVQTVSNITSTDWEAPSRGRRCVAWSGGHRGVIAGFVSDEPPDVKKTGSDV